MEKILRGCEMHPYEIMKDVDSPEAEYLFFRDLFLSKSSFFRFPEMEYGLSSIDMRQISNAMLIRDWN